MLLSCNNESGTSDVRHNEQPRKRDGITQSVHLISGGMPAPTFCLPKYSIRVANFVHSGITGEVG